MNRTALALTMLQILKSRSLIKKGELAELLETNPRNIIELKRELEVAGYNIETVSGPDGGYRLVDDSLLAVPDLTNEETEALKEVLSYLRSTDTALRKDAEVALQKVLGAALRSNNEQDEVYSSGVRLAISQKELAERYAFLQRMIRETRRVKIRYRQKNTRVEEWVIHPYGMFLYKGMWYLVGFREKDHEVTLKLNRIASLEETELKFYRPEDFDIRKYATSYGIPIRGQNHLKCRIKGRYYISEYIYGENQKISAVDDDTMLFEADFPNEMSMKSFVLDLGSDCTVLEPEWLRDYLKEESSKIQEKYE